jgi:hypothetical protein
MRQRRRRRRAGLQEKTTPRQEGAGALVERVAWLIVDEKVQRGIGSFHNARTGQANPDLGKKVFAKTPFAYERVNTLGPIQRNG